MEAVSLRDDNCIRRMKVTFTTALIFLHCYSPEILLNITPAAAAESALFLFAHDLQIKEVQIGHGDTCPMIPALGKLRQEERKYKASLGYTWETLPERQTNKQKKKNPPEPKTKKDNQPAKPKKTCTVMFEDILLVLLTVGETFVSVPSMVGKADGQPSRP